MFAFDGGLASLVDILGETIELSQLVGAFGLQECANALVFRVLKCWMILVNWRKQWRHFLRTLNRRLLPCARLVTSELAKSRRTRLPDVENELLVLLNTVNHKVVAILHNVDVKIVAVALGWTYFDRLSPVAVKINRKWSRVESNATF